MGELSGTAAWPLSPGMAVVSYWTAVGCWRCQIAHRRSMLQWCRKKSGSRGEKPPAIVPPVQVWPGTWLPRSMARKAGNVATSSSVTTVAVVGSTRPPPLSARV